MSNPQHTGYTVQGQPLTLAQSLESARRFKREVEARRRREAEAADKAILARKAQADADTAALIGPPDLRGILHGPVDMRPFMHPDSPRWRHINECYDLRDAWKWPPPWSTAKAGMW